MKFIHDSLSYDNNRSSYYRDLGYGYLAFYPYPIDSLMETQTLLIYPTPKDEHRESIIQSLFEQGYEEEYAPSTTLAVVIVHESVFLRDVSSLPERKVIEAMVVEIVRGNPKA